jgi:hypothetical protein
MEQKTHLHVVQPERLFVKPARGRNPADGLFFGGLRGVETGTSYNRGYTKFKSNQLTATNSNLILKWRGIHLDFLDGVL